MKIFFIFFISLFPLIGASQTYNLVNTTSCPIYARGSKSNCTIPQGPGCVSANNSGYMGPGIDCVVIHYDVGASFADGCGNGVAVGPLGNCCGVTPGPTTVSTPGCCAGSISAQYDPITGDITV